MKNSLIPYQFEDQPVRVLIRDGRPWFVAKDVCEALTIIWKGSDSTGSLRDLESDEKDLNTIETLGGKQEMTIISESGVYSLIFTSRKPEARRFRKWVTSEVLPAIAQTGRYGKIDLHHRLALSRQIASLTRALTRTKDALESHVLGTELRELSALAGQGDLNLSLLGKEVSHEA